MDRQDSESSGGAWHFRPTVAVVRSAAFVLLLASPTLASEVPGVVVESVGDPSPARDAGILPGDLLVSWERAAAPPANPDPAAGTLGSPFDLLEVEVEQAPRGPVRLLGRRCGEERSFEPGPGGWRLTARPRLSETPAGDYLSAASAIEAGDREAGVAGWSRLAESLGGETAAWLDYRIGTVEKESGDRERAAASFRRGLARAEGASAALAAAYLALAAAETEPDPAAAKEGFERALRLRRELASESLALASVYQKLGALARSTDEEASDGYFRRALDLREKLAPASLPVAESLRSLGWNALGRGDISAADELIGRAVAIAASVAPAGDEMAAALYYRGVLDQWRDDLAGSEEDLTRALAIAERNDPASKLTLGTLNSLGVLAKNRGDFVAAEGYYHRALGAGADETQRRVVLVNLAALAFQRGEPARARDFWQKALDIQGQGGATAYRTAALNGLGMVAREAGDFAEAERYHRQALELVQSQAPDSFQACGTQGLLGEVAQARGDLAAAEKRFAEAVRICDAILPGSVPVSAHLHALGELARDAGRLDEAEERFRRALAIRRALAPGTLDEAEAAHSLGLLVRDLGRRDEALDLLRAAVAALEQQSRRVGGGDEVRSSFRARYHRYYQDLLELLLDLGRPEDAFEVLERSRARVLLALLAERDLGFERDVPAELDRRRRRFDAEHDSILAELAYLAPEADAARVAELTDRLAELRRERREIRDSIRAAAPRLAALRYPEPLDLAGARRALAPGTLLLSYAVGPRTTYLFAVGPGADDFRVADLGIDEAGLRGRVEGLRARIAERDRRVARAAADLGRQLLGPVTEAVSRAERLLVVPDGPLHLLPFAALGDPAHPGHYLVEARPIALAASATVFAELARRRGEAAPVHLAAFGDPVYPAATADAAVSPALADLRRRGARLDPLPATREEVERLGALYGPSAAIYLGPKATEERAKALPADTSLVHFAGHALLDERFPLESALALSIPAEGTAGRDNGLLQAWEIFESVRLDADLVTLSACETALGREVVGEGMLGLTRAFHYAGARSVLASLWRIEDESTAELMAAFYAGLRAGLAKDEALRRAQLALVRGPIRVVRDGVPLERDASHPFYWAAFQLFGAWR